MCVMSDAIWKCGCIHVRPWPAVCERYWTINEDEPNYGICKVSNKTESGYDNGIRIEEEKCETCKAKDNHPKEHDKEGGQGGQGGQSSVG
jgi:hypothetical protein